jgi:hypothetical protein
MRELSSFMFNPSQVKLIELDYIPYINQDLS